MLVLLKAHQTNAALLTFTIAPASAISFITQAYCLHQQSRPSHTLPKPAFIFNKQNHDFLN